MSSLNKSLSAALQAREKRLIRRRLPEVSSSQILDFTSNDYLSLSTSPVLRNAVLAALNSAPQILGSGGSRLLVPVPAHLALEASLCRFLDAESALLFNSGFDANVGFFSAVPQPGDAVLYDAHIHASVHDGMRMSRLIRDSLIPFAHNAVSDLRRALARLIRDREGLKAGKTSVFVAVESLYSMDGTFAPLAEIVGCLEEMLPLGNGYLVVDEAHATGIYGPKGRGLVAALGLEKRVLARLHTFGKALAASGAVILTTELVRDYLLNYARSLIYTTTLTFANVIAVGCSFDLLEDGTTEVLSAHLLDLCTYFLELLRPELKKYPSTLLCLPDHLAEDADVKPSPSSPRSFTFPPPTPIIPILTPEPPPCPLPSPIPNRISIHTKPIFPPTVPPGTSRVRICLHAGHARADVEALVGGIIAWAEKRVREGAREREGWERGVGEVGVGVWMEARL
ncbi:pyridoxal phosphate-dependent transferase [Phlebopus sp. FC_14]|nr:pyridoxal phosphate-dependent transferase [Phlebopus sp. FC_14]